ncbi:hypothetical protein ACQKPE_13490 [Pseudomonas sp. NPDC089554]|uniref:hypothetical protein n=1 Tax=Pseudomonas sp. NPDC089554 TaxID=3390653 RepID=UPI003D059145
MARKGFNTIYSMLVTHEEGMLGVVAYSLYKRQKIEFIQSFKERHGRDPDDEDLSHFHHLSNSPTQLESYRRQADLLSQGFLYVSLEKQAAELEAFYASKADGEIRSARPGFWKGVMQSVVGSLLFVFMLGFLVFFTWSLNQGPKQVIEQVFDVTIIDGLPATPDILQAQP